MSKKLEYIEVSPEVLLSALSGTPYSYEDIGTLRASFTKHKIRRIKLFPSKETVFHFIEDLQLDNLESE